MDMSQSVPKGVSITPLKRIHHPKGDILHALKYSEISFAGFGEAYFTTVSAGEIKGWKKHKKMVMNLVVPIGEVVFHFFHENKSTFIKAGASNYVRITVEPDIWMAFEGVSEGVNLVLNIANLPHDPLESENVDIEFFPITDTAAEI
jgi:dTDP-4-dehydrorhamnose 3,5-epimerase